MLPTPATNYHDTTDDHIIFEPGKILGSFPLPSTPDLTALEATFKVMKDVTNVITINQPWPADEAQTLNPDVNPLIDGSDQFIIGNALMEKSLAAQNGIGYQSSHNK